MKKNNDNKEKKEVKEQKEQMAKEEAAKSAQANEVETAESECDQAQKQLQEYKEKADEANDKYLRLAAEFDNYRRRTARERLELINSASEEVIKGILPVLDDFERAIKVLKESESSSAAVEGTELIYNKLSSFLKGRGLVAIEALGKELDTEFHEAVAQFPTEEKEKKNKIIDVVQQGYTLNGKVVRYAKVVVGV